MSADLIAARNGFAADVTIAKGQKVVIPPPQAKTSLLPEARAMAMPPMMQAPVLLADAAELLPDEGPAPTKKILTPLSTTPVLTGTVKVLRVLSTPLETAELPAVDVIAGKNTALPVPDVIAGAPSSRPTLSEPVVEHAAGES